MTLLREVVHEFYYWQSILFEEFDLEMMWLSLGDFSTSSLMAFFCAYGALCWFRWLALDGMLSFFSRHRLQLQREQWAIQLIMAHAYVLLSAAALLGLHVLVFGGESKVMETSLYLRQWEEPHAWGLALLFLMLFDLWEMVVRLLARFLASKKVLFFHCFTDMRRKAPDSFPLNYLMRHPLESAASWSGIYWLVLGIPQPMESYLIFLLILLPLGKLAHFFLYCYDKQPRELQTLLGMMIYGSLMRRMASKSNLTVKNNPTKEEDNPQRNPQAR
jgi:hypothetical protein